jgi:hypothetical protein
MTKQEHIDWLIYLVSSMDYMDGFSQPYSVREGAFYFGRYVTYPEYCAKYAKAIKAMEEEYTHKEYTTEDLCDD